MSRGEDAAGRGLGAVPCARQREMREDAVHDGGVVEPMGMAEAECYGAVRSRYWTRAAVMRRAFDLEVLRGPRCAGRMELLATIVSRDPIS